MVEGGKSSSRELWVFVAEKYGWSITRDKNFLASIGHFYATSGGQPRATVKGPARPGTAKGSGLIETSGP